MYGKVKSHYTIALVIDWITTPYHRELLNGFCDYCEEHNLNSYIYVTGRIDSTWESERFRNVLLDFVKGSRLDGLVLTASSLCNISGPEVLKNYLKYFRNTPCVTIGEAFPGIPHVSHDNGMGVSLLMDHLIDRHGYTRFAFLRGSEDNYEAEARYGAFLDKLDERGLTIKKEHIFKGMFRHEDGYNAVLSLMERDISEVQVLFCSNDTQAMGAMQALKENQIAVPQQIALVGYDDNEFSSHSGFTTVRQSLWEEGRLAAEICHKQILGQPHEDSYKTQPRLIVRKSCGCVGIPVYPKEPPSETLGDDFRQRKEDFTPVHSSFVGLSLPEEEKRVLTRWLNELYMLYFKEVTGEEREMSFIDMWSRIVDWSCEFSRIHGVLERVRENFLDGLIALLPPESPWIPYWQVISDTTRNILEISLQSGLYCKKIFSENRMDDMDETGERLMSCWDQSSQMDVVAETFPSLGIRQCYISCYEDTQYPLGLSRLILAYDENYRYPLDSPGIQFPSSMLIPHGICQYDKRVCFVIQTLFQGGEQIGFSLFDASSRDWRSLEMLRHKLSLSLKNCEMHREIQGYTEKLEQQVAQRTGELQETNRKLHQEILERHKIEQELRKKEEYYRELALFLPTVIVELDRHLHPTFLNEAALSLFGTNDGEKICSDTLLSYIYEEDQEQAEEFFSKILKLKRAVYGEMRLLDQNMKPITVLVNASPIFRDNMVKGIRMSAMRIKPLLSSIVMPEELFFMHYHFSPRVKEVLLLMLQGYKTPEIAQKLFITESTVKAHIRAIYTETGVKKRSEFFKILEEYQVNHFGYHSYLYTLLSQLIKD
ncbi:MAG: substrate-binding domain-containing protein [Spirochaetales bacterium]|nr:substrate-binding domain-containing protein [Spirochaetales bacterium]